MGHERDEANINGWTGEEARAECRDLRKRRDELEAENAELNQIFDVQRSRMNQATQMMRDAGACELDELPDLGRLLEWLMGRLKPGREATP